MSNLFSSKLAQFGTTANGVHWNGNESQQIRFQQLCKLIDKPNHFSINDIGCGYGALIDYMYHYYLYFDYFGCDISPDMIQAAQKRFKKYPDINTNVHFVVGHEPTAIADYSVASGIFNNNRQTLPEAEWRRYLDYSLDILNKTSRLGFAFNCLTSYSDPDRKKPDLYYADPCLLFDYCKRKFSRHVALLHDYDLYDFTILVRKQLP